MKEKRKKDESWRKGGLSRRGGRRRRRLRGEEVMEGQGDS